MKIEERIDVEALLKSIGSLQDLQFRQRGLEPAMQQIVDAAKTLFKADGAGLMLIGEGEVLRWVTAQLIADSGAEERWPDLVRVLRHDGVHAVLSVPVQVAQGTLGTLVASAAAPSPSC